MIEKLFGETPEEQYQYLKPRLMATAISLVLLLLGGVLYLLGLTFGEVLAGAGSILFAVVTLVFGWAILRGLLGFASLGVLFSNNVVLGAVIFVLYITLGYFGGAFYDGRGVLQSSAGAVGVVGTSGEANGAVVGVLFLLSLPVVALWILTVRLIGWVSSHLYLVFGGYLLLTAAISYAIARRRKHRGLRAALSFTGSCLCLLSLAYIALVYAVPYVILHGGSFGDLFEFTAALAVGTAAVAILQFFNYYHGNAVWELILGVLFFAVVMILLRRGGEVRSLQDLAAIYGVEPTGLFRLLFRPAVP